MRIMSNEETQEETTEENKEQTLEDLGLSGKEVEEFMVKAAQGRAEDPAEMAATAYTMYGPYYKMAVPKLSKRSLRRILDYLIFYPLQKDSVHAANEVEKSVMQLANFLIEAKFIMIMAGYNDNLEKLVKGAETPLTEEQQTEIEKEFDLNIKGENNG